MGLPVKYKAFWFYICDQCDSAGIWEPNIPLATAQIGESIELNEILQVFKGRIEALPGDKFWIKQFVDFQYGILSSDCKPHLPILKRLQSLGLERRVSIPFPKGIDTLQEKEQEKEKDRKGGVQRGKTKPPSQQIPTYDKPGPTRQPTDEEFAKMQAIAREETEALRRKLA